MRFLLLIVVLGLAACASQPPRAPLRPPLRPAHELISNYAIEGRVVVKRGAEARQAGIEWRHAASSDEILLSGPLGQRAGRLTRDDIGAHLETSTHELVSAADWSDLAERVLGVALPLDQIARWIPANIDRAYVTEVTERDDKGRPRRLLANGWQVDYLSYESDEPNALPTLLELEHDDIKVHLKIDQWQIN